MNCTEARNDLIDLVVGTLPAERRQHLETHLLACPCCRAERDSLQEATALLQAAPAPAVQIDVAALYREAARREQKRLRRWRRTALACGTALAALLALTIGLNLEVRLERHQFVLRWGAPPPPDEPAAPTEVRVPPPREQPVTAEEMERRLGRLHELVQGLAASVQSLELEQRQELGRLRAGLQALRQQAVLHQEMTGKDVDALYVDRFLDKKRSEP
ncbi:MAG: hypothetical protein HYS12_14870 [Planctomycetes bacterium]|nr:hypothetical protein [Planctomycetota bacterium]